MIGFLEHLYKQNFPFPGEKLSIMTSTFSSYLNGLHELQRPDDENFHSDIDLEPLFTTLSPNQLLPLFTSVLEERRIIFSGSNIRQLTLCVMALVELLYPLKWQHIFIPVLPMKLLDYVCAPMPFIVGIHSSMLPKVLKMPIESLIIVNLDSKEMVGAPSSIKLPLEKTLYSNISKSVNDEYIDSEEILNSFLQFWVKIFGTYRRFMKKEGNSYVFKDQEFIQSFQDKDIKDFISKLMNTSQIFQQFIQEKVELCNSGQFPTNVFEFECSKLTPSSYGITFDEKNKNIQNTLKNAKDKIVSFGKKELKRTKRQVTKTVKNLTSKEIFYVDEDEDEDDVIRKLNHVSFTKDELKNESVNKEMMKKFKGKFDEIHYEMSGITQILIDFDGIEPTKPKLPERPHKKDNNIKQQPTNSLSMDHFFVGNPEPIQRKRHSGNFPVQPQLSPRKSGILPPLPSKEPPKEKIEIPTSVKRRSQDLPPVPKTNPQNNQQNSQIKLPPVPKKKSDPFEDLVKFN